MREDSLLIQDALVKGLRQREHMPRNSSVLSTCQFMKPTERGLRSIEGITDVLTSVTRDWPFPQVLILDESAFVFEATSIKPFSTTTWLVTGAAVGTYKLEDDSTSRSILSGGVWQFASFGTNWIACNSNSIVVSDNRYVGYGNTHKYLATESACNAICAHRGRALFGGFGPSFTWPSHWSSLTGELSGETSMDYSNFQPGDNWVFWSPINSDLTLIWEAPRNLSRLVRSNRFGFSPMPWSGTVYAMMELGKSVVVYGDNGIAIMRMVTEPVPTYSIEKIADFGIRGRGAVGGDKEAHLFITSEGVLWRLTEQRGLERLGYEEFLETALYDDLVIGHDPVEGDFYIGGGTAAVPRSWVLSPSGLGTSPYRASSLFTFDGGLCGTLDTDSDTEVIVATDWIDLGGRHFKTITTVEASVDSSQDIYVAVDYSNDDGRSATRSAWVKLNSQGWARIQKTAILFRICLKVDSYLDCSIDSIQVHWQNSGLRTVRGRYDNQVKL